MPGQISSLHEVTSSDRAGYVYGPKGRTLYTLELTGLNSGSAVLDLSGQGGPSIAYFGLTGGSSSSINEVIENFRVAGPRHDTIDLSKSGLQSLVDVLNHTTMNGGNATIHLDQKTTLTLDNVTKQQIAASHHDFVFPSVAPSS